MLRKTSSTKAIDDLDVERCYGDLFDEAAVRAAMTGCDVIYYCVVDARMWLRDPTPLFRTNVDGLRAVLDVATEDDIAAGLRKFVFTSTIGTLAISKTGLVTEDDPRNWTEGGAYVEARVAAEELLFEYVRDRGLPGVAMCVSTTYGPGDWQPTPHGGQVAMVAAGKMPFYPDFGLEVVGIEDAARAMLLAAEKGRNGERYIISDRFMTMREIRMSSPTPPGCAAPESRCRFRCYGRRPAQRPGCARAAPRPDVRLGGPEDVRADVAAGSQQGRT